MAPTADARDTLLGFDVQSVARALIEAEAFGEHDWRVAQEVSRQNGHSPLRSLLDLGLISEDALADRVALSLGRPRWRAEDEEGVVSDELPPRVHGHAWAARAARRDSRRRARRVAAALHLRGPLGPSRLGGGPVAASGARGARSRGPEGHHPPFWRSARRRPRRSTRAKRRSMSPPRWRSCAISPPRRPVIRFFNQTVERAMELGASDIHLERYDGRVSLRLRVDGMLAEQPPPPMRLYEPLLCRIKIMASLDIAERRLAQDGRIRMRLRGRMVDLRVSLVPTMYGQDAALRLQDRQRLSDIDLSDLGFSDDHVSALVRAASKSHGIVLVTGPHRLGQDDHALRAAPEAREPGAQDRHRRGSGRVRHERRQPDPGQSRGGARVREHTSPHPAPRSGRHSHW